MVVIPAQSLPPTRSGAGIHFDLTRKPYVKMGPRLRGDDEQREEARRSPVSFPPRIGVRGKLRRESSLR